MRRHWYLGLGMVLLAIFLILMMLQHVVWFLLVLIPLILIAVYDINQKKHAILRNFPILGHIRFFLEFFRPEIQQYFVADDESERPYNREIRSIIYQRSKNVRDTVPFGTERNIVENGYEWALHSLAPKSAEDIETRIIIGSDQCSKPYSASRLNISAMSFGALSSNAILALNKGAKIGAFAHNTGEGGLSPYHLAGGGDIIWQIGTGYFGCRDQAGNFSAEEFSKEAQLDAVKMIEIKLSQGAKPGHGGILPAEKLTPEIAAIRKVSTNQDVISPPAHSAFSTPKGLLDFVQKLRELSGGKPIGFKLCLGQPNEFLAICKAMIETQITPDFITIDGAEGGTGAAPLEYTNRIGTPLDDALNFVNQALIACGMRKQIKLICSGKIATGFDMLSKIALGADLCNAARAMMMSVGCIQSRQCNANTCPTGVATQDKRLANGLVVDEKKIRVAHYHENTVHAFLELVGAVGLDSIDQLQPKHIMRRLSPDVVKSYEAIYGRVKPGELLGDKPTGKFASLWTEVTADSFTKSPA